MGQASNELSGLDRIHPHFQPSRSWLLNFRAPRSQRGSFAAGDPAGDKAFGDVAARKVKVTEAASQLACCIEPSDWCPRRVDDLLLWIMNRSALSIRYGRKHFSIIIGRVVYPHH